MDPMPPGGRWMWECLPPSQMNEAQVVRHSALDAREHEHLDGSMWGPARSEV